MYHNQGNNHEQLTLEPDSEEVTAQTTFNNIPQEMKDRHQWLLWQLVDKGQGKRTKVPKTVSSGGRSNASVDRPTTWDTFDNALRVYNTLCVDGQDGGLFGLGFVFTKDDEFFGLDFDKCVDAAGNISPVALQFLERFPTYTEWSLSKKGFHVIGTSTTPLPVDTLHQVNSPASDFSKMELYDRNRFFVMTGNVYQDKKHLTDQSKNLHEFQKEYFTPIAQVVKGPSNGSTTGRNRTQDLLDTISRDDKRKVKFFRLYADGDISGYANDDSKADMALCSMLAYWTGGDAEWMDELFRKSALMRNKWDRKTGNETYGTITINNALRSAKRFYTPVTKDDVALAVDQVNKEYALVNLGSEVRIIDESNPDEPMIRNVGGWKTFMANRFIGNKKLADVWIEHPDRRTYKEVVFAIPKAKDNEYNLWRGLSGIVPAAGDWTNIRYHIHDIICASDEPVYDYLIRWIAHLVQRPEEKPQVAIVMRSEQGTGKGIFANHIIAQVVGSKNYIAVDKPEHLTGHFNKHLATSLVVFADEALFAGNKAQQNVLKSIITEPTFNMEAKNHDPISIRSYHRVMMATNSDWVVNSSADERRYLILDVSEKHQVDNTYFTTLVNSIQNELPAFMDYLLKVDISNFNVRNAPKTEGLREQTIYSQDTFDSWFSGARSDGRIVLLGPQPEVLLDFSITDEQRVRKEDLYASYETYANRMKEHHLKSKTAFGIAINRASFKKREGLWIDPDQKDGRNKNIYIIRVIPR